MGKRVSWRRPLCRLTTRIDKRSIQADGTMKNEVTFNFPDGRTETGWMVFEKVGVSGRIPLTGGSIIVKDVDKVISWSF